MKVINTFSKKSLSILFFMLVFTPVFGQEYGVIPAVVREKMDLNKANGLPTYSGIVTAYLVDCQGLDNNDIIELNARAENNNSVQSLVIHSLQSIEVICFGGTSFDVVKPIFSELVDLITQISIDNRIE